MAVKVKTKFGKFFTLLNPSEKATKYAKELQNNYALTNDMKIKTDENGVIKNLASGQRSYRAGYLAACEDSADAYKAKHPDKYPRDIERQKKKARRERRRANSRNNGGQNEK